MSKARSKLAEYPDVGGMVVITEPWRHAGMRAKYPHRTTRKRGEPFLGKVAQLRRNR